MAHPHQKWAESQIAALLEIDVDLLDAERSVKAVLEKLPDGADPAIWLQTPEQLMQRVDSPEAIQDDRVAWLANDSIAPRFKRVLDARTEPVSNG